MRLPASCAGYARAEGARAIFATKRTPQSVVLTLDGFFDGALRLAQGVSRALQDGPACAELPDPRGVALHFPAWTGQENEAAPIDGEQLSPSRVLGRLVRRMGVVLADQGFGWAGR